MSSPVRVAVVGCGAISTRRHIPELARNSSAKLVGFCDVVIARAEEQAKKYDARAWADFSEMIKDPDIDAVVLGVPNYLHAPMTIDALKHGKHVLVEKPMATARAEAKAMIIAAKKANKILMVGQNQRLMPPHIKAREILASGRLGKIISFRTAFKHSGPDSWSIDKGPGTWFFKKKFSIMGVCGDLGIHKADLMRYLLNDEFVEVTAMIDTLSKTYANGKKIDVDDNAMIVAKTRQGLMGSIIISWTNYGEPEANYTYIYCEKGVLMLATDPTYGVIVRYRDGQEERYKLGAISTNEKQVSSGVSDMFIHSVVSGKEPPINGVEGYRSLDVILAAFESSDSGKAIKIKHTI